MSKNENDRDSSESRQEEIERKDPIREGRRRKGGINDESKTPRPRARPQPQKPSDSSSESADEDEEGGG